MLLGKAIDVKSFNVIMNVSISVDSFHLISWPSFYRLTGTKEVILLLFHSVRIFVSILHFRAVNNGVGRSDPSIAGL